VPNMRFFPDDPEYRTHSQAIKPDDVHLIFTSSRKGKVLSELFAMLRNASTNFDLVWACCRDLALRETGYKAVRVEQRADGFYDFDFDAGVYTKIFNRAGLRV